MRFVVGLLASLSLGAISLALADPSTTAPDTAAQPADAKHAPAAPAPQTASPPAAAKADVDPDEKRILGQGYEPEMHNGEKVFCRREEELGTRLGGVKHCGTIAQLKAEHAELRESVEKAQRTSVMPQGR